MRGQDKREIVATSVAGRLSNTIKFFERGRGVRRLIRSIASSLRAFVCAALTLQSSVVTLSALVVAATVNAQSPPALTLSEDLNRDGIAETITADANQLTVVNGASMSPLVRIRGDAPSDGFGSAALVIPDANGDGEPELLVAAPNAFGGRGAVYLFRSP